MFGRFVGGRKVSTFSLCKEDSYQAGVARMIASGTPASPLSDAPGFERFGLPLPEASSNAVANAMSD